MISAIGAGTGEQSGLIRATTALIGSLKQAGVKRLLVVGGAGSLEVEPGLQLVDSPALPAAHKAPALAHRELLEILRGEAELEWTYLSPPAMIVPGERTGRFRLGRDQLVVDGKGESRISAEDYAVAMLDEVEQRRHIRQRSTLGY